VRRKVLVLSVAIVAMAAADCKQPLSSSVLDAGAAHALSPGSIVNG
jgi:mannitol-specific phosphotransferase system IIBC component